MSKEPDLSEKSILESFDEVVDWFEGGLSLLHQIRVRIVRLSADESEFPATRERVDDLEMLVENLKGKPKYIDSLDGRNRKGIK